MRSLSFIILLLAGSISLLAQNPHGENFKVNCAVCHSSDSWEIPMDSWKFEEDSELKISRTTGWELGGDSIKFNHNATNFPLEGQHAGVDCRECHADLVFAETPMECISCHTDIHQQTVGSDCVRCHNSENWLVDNITELHQDNGFPLLGVHAQISCVECHTSETGLQFNRLGNECLNCHLEDFNATTDPNHIASGFSTECIDCHLIEGFDWSSEFINHDFFPLTGGHDIADCNACHTNGTFKDTPTDCIACHQADYETALNPNHQSANFSTNCVDCHTTDVDWMPANYQEHDNFFPIYSGEHEGEWDACVDCHLNPNDFSEFTCTTCHERNETDGEHRDVNGYVYESRACLACHPTGSEDDNFDHNRTRFPLNGAHVGVDCIECHANGYAGTPTDCASCHLTDYNQTTNPDHKASGFNTECQVCHSETAWIPATFDHNNTDFPLTGAHITVDCIECHADGYEGTPTDCNACHQMDFDQSVNPNHKALGLSTDCVSCHTTAPDWMPATFDIHDQFYPLNGAHAKIANDCAACHNGDYNNTPNTCFGCHQDDYNQAQNPNHLSAGFPTDCESCHTEIAWEPANFNHDALYFPIYSGTHRGEWDRCVECHTTPNDFKSFSCIECHEHNDPNDLRDEHDGVNGYKYESNACYQCHPNGD